MLLYIKILFQCRCSVLSPSTCHLWRVIFTTAYEQYAIQGFELEVLDYLLKPVSFERFLKSANKAYEYFEKHRQEAASWCFVKVEQRLEKVLFADMVYVEATGNYVSIQTKTGKLITHVTLKGSQESLLANQFIQPHKSFLVNIDHIKAIEGNMLHMTTGQCLISKYQKEEVLERIVNNKLIRR